MFFKWNILLLVVFVSPTLKAQISPGLWRTTCQAGLFKEQILLDNRQIILTEHFHQDANCKDISFRFQTSGDISYAIDYPHYIDFVYSDIELTLFKQIVVDNFNQRKVCGLDNWKIAEPQTITGLKCAMFNLHKETQIPRRLDRKYGIFSIENNKLFYGKLTQNHDGSSPEKRPQQLDQAIEYIFQKSF